MSREDQQYAIRFRGRARLEINNARVRLAEITNPDHAMDWYNGFLDSLATLADNPNRHPIAHEDRFFQDTVYVFLYRQASRSFGYHVFYTIVDDTEDAPFVHILHIRHGARKPMTRAEVREIDADR